MTRFRTLILIVTLPLLSCGGSGPVSEPMNILFIAIDTLRADRMSLYGYEQATTPEIDAFAADALVFDRAHSPSSWTRASFASYFTGLTPHAHGCESHEGALAESHLTLAERLRDAGWTTASIYANANIAPEFGFDQGFDLYEHPPLNAGYPGDFRVTDAAEMNRRLIRWLRDERPDDEPWFLFALYMDPHDPYLPHDEHVFGPRPHHGMDGSRRFLKTVDNSKRMRRENEMRKLIRGLYDGETAYVDAHVGALLDELEALGLMDDTVIVITADHGEGLFDHERYRSHGRQVYQGQIHVPLVLRWPGVAEPGRVETPVNVLDVFGTLVDGFGLERDGTLDQAGSLLDIKPVPLYVEEKLDDLDMRVVIDWPWKLILNVGGDPELFDLETDPREQTDLATDHADVVERLTAVAAERRAEGEALRAATGDIAPVAIDDATRRELEALGYIN